MEPIAALLFPALITLTLMRFLALPVRLLYKTGIHGLCGFVCLWLVNTTTPFTGVAIPVNAITVLTAGALGLPGIGLLAVLSILN